MKPLIVVCLVLGSLGLLSGCGSGSVKPTPGMTCTLNSDCAAGLTCTFGACHTACVANGDCPTGQLCVKSSVTGDAGANDAGTTNAHAINVCQLPTEKPCVYNSNCNSPLVCARDEQCRNQCQLDVDCISPQVCTSSKVCALTSQLEPGTNDVRLVTTGQDGGGADTKGAGGAAGSGTGGGATAGAGGAAGGAGKGGTGGGAGKAGACAGPPIEFPNVSQGDSNPYFTSAVAVRNADTLFIFSAYAGPASVDGGADGGAVAGDAIFVQMFDPVTGSKRGPSKFLFSVPTGAGFGVNDVSVASTGEIALIYTVASQANSYADQLYGTFLNATPGDGGTATLSVVKTVQLESVNLGDPHVIWQPEGQLFVVSWKYQGSNGWYVRVRKFHPNGTASGSAVNAVPTIGALYQPNQEDDSSASVSGSYLGVAYQSTNDWPYFTILDSDGLQVGPYITLQTSGIDNWAAAGGTTLGFVTMYTGGGRVSGAFVPVTGMSSVLADAGAPDAGLPPLKTFSFTSTATTGKLINDDAGGAGGVGAVLLETAGAAFAYVTADGSKLYAQGTVISKSGGVQADISNFQGSFVVSLYNGTAHAAQATVSTCP